ncbi:HIT domain-containing protein [Brevundimonas sp. PAMC22021]|uniref:HIT domain-containing protein n=1 Tax=Brevundimonas sp. PAMC22021 TaxID=2861285 RepID=UPI001C630688|nr:HIT domain-containing protein [Brevundimonas sp. PAMC22021]QYF86620.1 HIT domain-containing protein [Brevundimonas sp. PAMC22021]
MTFAPDPAFSTGSVAVTEWPLCHVRLQDDGRFPWIILIPRIDGAVELEDLSADQQSLLMEETVRAGRIVRRVAERLGRPIDKLNVGAIGNVTAQLHVHVLGRRRDDPLWPDPVWGRGPALPYSSVAMVEAMDEIAAG